MLQKQMAFGQAVLHLDHFRMAAAPAVSQKLSGILRRAGEACEVLSDTFDLKSITSWIGVLQRSLGAAVKATFEHIACDILQETNEIEEGHHIKEHRNIIWKALS